MKLADWIAEKVTKDPRAMRWFDTPEGEDRIARCYKELLGGYDIDPATILKTTRMLGAKEVPGKVLVKDIVFYSICAHHFLPFFGKISICYVPGDRILGLGKLPRLVQAYSQRFQIQEDLVREIAHEMMNTGHARGVHVKSAAQHLCMLSRGPKNPSSVTDAEFALGTLSDQCEYGCLSKSHDVAQS
ncbi:MAG: GTP cyclohydrolase I [Myxococcota bacterium]